MVMNIVVWAVFGLIAGWLAKFIGNAGERTDPAGLVMTILLGIGGAVLGGFISTKLFSWDIDSFSVPGLAVAVGGALLLLLLYRLFTSAKRNI
jgi:uncharacterized membrane protein YeaQ/YmgE (transglycosylase-associated protein family)